MRRARVIVMRGTAGYIEDERFRLGIETLLKEAVASGAKVIIDGGIWALWFRRDTIDPGFLSRRGWSATHIPSW
jgi:3-phosphoglycerate kinase